MNKKLLQKKRAKRLYRERRSGRKWKGREWMGENEEKGERKERTKNERK